MFKVATPFGFRESQCFNHGTLLAPLALLAKYPPIRIRNGWRNPGKCGSSH